MSGGSWDDRFRHCPLCGGELALRRLFGLDRKACTDRNCGYVQFRSPAAAAAVVVMQAGQVLLVQRDIEPYRGCWGFPAGYQDYHESPQDAAIRETREETGLIVQPRRVLDVFYTLDDPRKRSNVTVFLADVVAGELRAADDARDAAFFALDALPEAIAFDNNRRLLARLAQDYLNGDIE